MVAEEKIPSDAAVVVPSSYRPSRDQPDLTHCQGCGDHFPPANGITGGYLCALPSEWRIVLLCTSCLSTVRSGSICSYCLRPSSVTDSVKCHRCSARVHLRCAPREQRYLLVSDLCPNAHDFSCVDCSALPKSLKPLTINSQFNHSIDHLRRQAEEKSRIAVRAKANALSKAAAAKRAAERARSALDALVVVQKRDKEGRSLSSRRDEEIALRLHLAMNGSRRILRNRGGSKSNNVHVQLCTEDKSLLAAGQSCSSGSSCVERSMEDDHERSCSSSDLKQGEQEGSSRDDNKSYLVKYSRKKDWYLKKYSRRKSRLEGIEAADRCQLYPCWQNRSSDASVLAPDVHCFAPRTPRELSAHIDNQVVSHDT